MIKKLTFLKMLMNVNNFTKYTFFFALILLNIFCSKNKTPNLLIKNSKMERFHIVVKYSLPFEILVNDIVIAKDLKNGYQGAENISLYFDNNNVQKIKVRFFPDTENNMKIIPASSISKQNTSIFTTKNGNETRVMDLATPPITQDLPFYEYEWKFDAQAIKGLNNLNNSEDLSKMKKEDLEKKVLSKFSDLEKILNDGNGKQFMKEIQTAKENLFLSEDMSTDKQKEYSNNLEEYFDSHKGTLSPINNFNLKIMGNGKAVALEYASGKNQGLGILSSEDIPNKTMNVNYIILHKPVGSDKFEVFRYNCSFNSLDN